MARGRAAMAKPPTWLLPTLIITLLAVLAVFVLWTLLADEPCPGTPSAERAGLSAAKSKFTGDLSDPLVTTTPDDFLLMLIGDGGNSDDSRSLLALAASEGVDMVIHAGDFEYLSNPQFWDDMITDALGADFPYFGVAGNHDVDVWYGYEQVMLDRLARVDGVVCEEDGVLGVRSWCMYRGVMFVGTGVGTICKQDYHEDYLRVTLPAMYNATRWRICSWHKNQHLMQIGGKSDEVGWQAYELCRENGYIIHTGHEHSYSRTHAVSKFDESGATVANTNNTINVFPGQTFAFVSGLGGKSYRDSDPDLRAKPWWAAVHASEDDATAGAVFCTLNPSGVQGTASCYFKNIRGETHDTFSVTMSA